MRNETRAALRAGAVAQDEGDFALPETEGKEFKFKSVFTKDGAKNVFKKFGLRNLVIILSVLLIGGAVYVNWRIFGMPDAGADTDVKAGTDVTDTPGDDGTEKTIAGFFATSQVDRQRARDEAIEVLQNIVVNDKTLDSEKAEALTGISAIAASIEAESNIESLIKAKGFSDCVTVINGNKATVVVSSEGLKPNELAQILEIVYLQANILPENVTITEIG